MNNRKPSNSRLARLSDEALLAKLSPQQQRIFLDRLIAEDFGAFIKKVFETVSPGKAFRANWLVDAMTWRAEEVVDGKVKRLLVTVPPRHLKSIVFSVALPAFLLGRDPTKRIICVSYSNDLAVKHANDFRAVVTSDWYRRAFPNTVISKEKDTQSETMTMARGFRFATSVGGTLTGRGADIIILDDPQKPDEALSEASRNSVGTWFDTTLLQRLDSKSDGAVVIVMQRVHEDDLVGRQLEKGGWEHLRVPAIAVQDERIQIGRRKYKKRKVGDIIDPNGDSREDLDVLRRSMGELFFSAQYQQEPVPLAGNIVKAEWLKTYDATPALASTDTVVISIDTAMKGTPSADYSVATVWLMRGDKCFLLDLWRQQVDYPELKKAVLGLRQKYSGATVLIEDKGSGTGLIQDLRSENIMTIAINPEGDKVTRLANVSAQFEAGAVLFPKEAPWLKALFAELLAFPNARHDDQVDSVSQALLWAKKRRLYEIPIVVPIIISRPRDIWANEWN